MAMLNVVTFEWLIILALTLRLVGPVRSHALSLSTRRTLMSGTTPSAAQGMYPLLGGSGTWHPFQLMFGLKANLEARQVGILPHCVVLSSMICGLDDEVKKEPISWDSGGRFGRHLYSASHPCNSLCTERIQRPGETE